jgi:hypothetical protein
MRLRHQLCSASMALWLNATILSTTSATPVWRVRRFTPINLENWLWLMCAASRMTRPSGAAIDFSKFVTAFRPLRAKRGVHGCALFTMDRHGLRPRDGEARQRP